MFSKGPFKKALPPLENGDRLDQKTFHARYEAMPDGVRAELIGGIVYMSSPLKRHHGRYALLRRDRKRLLAVLRQGLASPEHAAFVAKLPSKKP